MEWVFAWNLCMQKHAEDFTVWVPCSLLRVLIQPTAGWKLISREYEGFVKDSCLRILSSLKKPWILSGRRGEKKKRSIVLTVNKAEREGKMYTTTLWPLSSPLVLILCIIMKSKFIWLQFKNQKPVLFFSILLDSSRIDQIWN